MNRFAPAGFRLFRCLTAGLAAACLALGGLQAPAAAAADQGVLTAEQRLEAARQHAETGSSNLDAVAESYELANAHQQRLQNELEQADAQVAAADAEVLTAEQRLAERVTAAYKRPGAKSALTDAVLLALTPAVPCTVRRCSATWSPTAPRSLTT